MKIGQYPNVERAMDHAAGRQQVLSSNLANIDTPDYQAKDVQFLKELESLQVKTTSPLHMTVGNQGGRLVYETGGKIKDNGNSVDLDHQITELTKNGLQYVTMIEYLNQKLQTLRSAINEGGKA
jgi:flagellar basal-body rod protein FlgB